MMNKLKNIAELTIQLVTKKIYMTKCPSLKFLIVYNYEKNSLKHL